MSDIRDKLAAKFAYVLANHERGNEEIFYGDGYRLTRSLADALLASDVLRDMLAEAWDEGAEAAYFDPEMRGQVNYPDNPYRDRIERDGGN